MGRVDAARRNAGRYRCSEALSDRRSLRSWPASSSATCASAGCSTTCTGRRRVAAACRGEFWAVQVALSIAHDRPWPAYNDKVASPRSRGGKSTTSAATSGCSRCWRPSSLAGPPSGGLGCLAPSLLHHRRDSFASSDSSDAMFSMSSRIVARAATWPRLVSSSHTLPTSPGDERS